MPAFCIDMTSGILLTVFLLLHPTLLFMQLGFLYSVPGRSKKLPGCRRVQNICRRSPVRRRKKKPRQSETSVLRLCFKVSRTVLLQLLSLSWKKRVEKNCIPHGSPTQFNTMPMQGLDGMLAAGDKGHVSHIIRHRCFSNIYSWIYGEILRISINSSVWHLESSNAVLG